MALFPLSRGDHAHGPAISGQAKSIASIIAIVAAVGSFMVDNAMMKIAVAVVAVLAGLIGMVRAVSPRVSGGILSMVAIVVAVIGLLAAILDTVGIF